MAELAGLADSDAESSFAKHCEAAEADAAQANESKGRAKGCKDPEQWFMALGPIVEKGGRKFIRFPMGKEAKNKDKGKGKDKKELQTKWGKVGRSSRRSASTYQTQTTSWTKQLVNRCAENCTWHAGFRGGSWDLKWTCGLMGRRLGSGTCCLK